MIKGLFEPDGWLQQVRANSKYRIGQAMMAESVARTIQQGGLSVMEAGTGVGKTYAYVLPALLSGRRVLISTATKNLQDQLFNRDIPELVQLLGQPVRTALLKGRSSYLCLHRMERAAEAVRTPAVTAALRKIISWSRTTQRGDLAELPGLGESSTLIPLITSTRDNCLGTDCPQARDCHVNKARREAASADVVVINHHLYFSDHQLRQTGHAQLLPSAEVVVFDEAHVLADVGRQYLGLELGTSQLMELCRDLLSVGLQKARGLAPWPDIHGALELAIQRWRLCWPEETYNTRRLEWEGPAPSGVDGTQWTEGLQALESAVRQAVRACANVLELDPEFARLNDRLQEIMRRLNLFGQACPAEHVRWIELSRQVRMVQTPLHIGEWMKSHVWAAPNSADEKADGATRARAFILTSATLTQQDRFDWFVAALGLEESATLRVPSPFDYARQGLLLIPRDMPEPAHPGHAAAVAAMTRQVVQHLRGKTLVLTTSLKAMQLIAQTLRADDGVQGMVEVLCQGESPKHELVERFRQVDANARGAVLVGSASFWEGVDIPGHALSCVIIDKLPFPSPADPWMKALGTSLRSKGLNPFQHHALPQAILALKQGVGRLIRQETDTGLMIIADKRLLTASYGRMMLASLPPMTRVTHLEEAWARWATHQSFHQGLPDETAPLV